MRASNLFWFKWQWVCLLWGFWKSPYQKVDLMSTVWIVVHANVRFLFLARVSLQQATAWCVVHLSPSSVSYNFGSRPQRCCQWGFHHNQRSSTKGHFWLIMQFWWKRQLENSQAQLSFQMSFFLKGESFLEKGLYFCFTYSLWMCACFQR